MRFLVKPRVEVEGAPIVEWAEVEVEGEDRWGALVAAAESLGLDRLFTMSSLWKKSSIVKLERRGGNIREFRVSEASISEVVSKSKESKKRWKFF